MATIWGLVLGLLALVVARLALSSFPEPIEALVGAIDLSTTVIGYISLAAGLAAAIQKAIGAGGIAELTTETAAGPAVFALAGAILLIS